MAYFMPFLHKAPKKRIKEHTFAWYTKVCSLVVAGVGFEPHDLRVMRCSYKLHLKIERVDKTCTVGLLPTEMTTNKCYKILSATVGERQKTDKLLGSLRTVEI